MSFKTFFPSDVMAAIFVFSAVGWFAFWIYRLRREATHLQMLHEGITSFGNCIEQLRTHQLWRDRERIQGKSVAVEPAAFFNTTCVAKVTAAGALPVEVATHFQTIFVAGCEESSLDVSELNSQTCKDIAAKSEQLRNELFLLFLIGVLGTLVALPGQYSAAAFAKSVRLDRALPPLIWGTVLTLAGSLGYLQFQQRRLAPVLAELRRKTTTLWVPKLYPTVAQRAAQWAIHTLHNAARVTDASEVIEKHATNFVASIESARRAADVFSGGMREFSHGIEASDRALQNAQTKLAGEVSRFADSLGRWGSFEDEIRRFYAAVENHQRQIVHEHKTFEAMLSGYYDLVRTSTNVLQQSAYELSSVAKTLPAAFATSAEKMTQTAAAFQGYLAATVAETGDVMKAAYREDSAEMQARLQTIVGPVLNMEDRLRALGTPFESASNKLVEIAENLWRLNDNFEQKVSKSLADLQANQSRSAKTGL